VSEFETSGLARIIVRVMDRGIIRRIADFRNQRWRAGVIKANLSLLQILRIDYPATSSPFYRPHSSIYDVEQKRNGRPPSAFLLIRSNQISTVTRPAPCNKSQAKLFIKNTPNASALLPKVKRTAMTSKQQPSQNHRLLPPLSSMTNNSGNQDSSHNRSSRMLQEAWIDRNLMHDNRNVGDILSEALAISSQLRMVLEKCLPAEFSLDDEDQEDSN